MTARGGTALAPDALAGGRVPPAGEVTPVAFLGAECFGPRRAAAPEATDTAPEGVR